LDEVDANQKEGVSDRVTSLSVIWM
jgi:hypothetical protein